MLPSRMLPRASYYGSHCQGPEMASITRYQITNNRSSTYANDLADSDTRELCSMINSRYISQAIIALNLNK